MKALAHLRMGSPVWCECNIPQMSKSYLGLNKSLSSVGRDLKCLLNWFSISAITTYSDREFHASTILFEKSVTQVRCAVLLEDL